MKHMMKVIVHGVERDEDYFEAYDSYVLVSAKPIDKAMIEAMVKSHNVDNEHGSASYRVVDMVELNEAEYDAMYAEAVKADASYLEDRFIRVDLDSDKAIEIFGNHVEPWMKGNEHMAINYFFRFAEK